LKLRNSPSEKIVVTGCNSDAGAERNNRELSRARAAAVRDYLTQVWGIESSRIDLQARDLPENPSSTNVPDGNVENRRVEITGPDNRILDPIFFTDTIRTVNAGSIAISPDIQADTAIASWSVNITQGARVLEKLAGKGKPPVPIQWQLKGRPEVYPRSKEPLRFDVDVVDATGQRQVVQAPSMQVDQVYRSDKKTEKFSMIIFGFNEAEFTKQHERILDIIRPRVYPNSKVTVEGYTDRLGAEDYNLRLSQRRAREVATRLNVKRDNAIGYGSANSLFDNDTPEGRLYSRTVLITIETPVE
jgi:outer membrane protein OmpA-like peptidoglycan-associated protein